MPGYYIWTIGCQMNKAESERLAAYLEARDYRQATVSEADLIVLNSCVVRQSAENKVRRKLDSLAALKRHRPGLELALTGCLVEGDAVLLRQQFPQVDHFFVAGQAPLWRDAAPAWRMAPGGDGPTHYVPIMQGCNNYCTYCIVPYRRGPECSRKVAEIVTEVSALAAGGTREVTLLGQNVDSYGQDLPGRPDLAALLYALDGVPGLRRIRFLTSHPKDISPALIAAVCGLDKVCEHISLPVQAGSDRMLRAMRRGYRVGDYRDLVARVRRGIPGVALSTDVIVGFPGETAAEFRETLDLLSALKFDTVHVAAYSVRLGTAAARDLVDDVPGTEKRARLAAVEAQQQAIAGEINRARLGTSVEVLVEARKQGKWWGRSRGDKLVFFTGEASPGDLIEIKITQAGPWSLRGEPV